MCGAGCILCAGAGWKPQARQAMMERAAGCSLGRLLAGNKKMWHGSLCYDLQFALPVDARVSVSSKCTLHTPICRYQPRSANDIKMTQCRCMLACQTIDKTGLLQPDQEYLPLSTTYSEALRSPAVTLPGLPGSSHRSHPAFSRHETHQAKTGQRLRNDPYSRGRQRIAYIDSA